MPKKDARMSESVLVAGGAGYIGAHVCKALAAAGYVPVTLDNLRTGHREFARFGPFVQGCVSNSAVVAQAVKQYRIRAAIDLAGSSDISESLADPLGYYENNMAAKLNFLRTLHAYGVAAFVFSSSACVYGEPSILPIPELHPLMPKNPYGWSKLAFEQALRDMHAAGGPRFMVLRYFNAAGASPDGDIGERHEPESHLIPRACFAALGQGQPLEIYGDDYPTPDGTAIRDYVHVSDLAAAHVLAVEALLGGALPATYNLGRGMGVSVREVLGCFERLGHAVPHAFKPRRAGDAAILVADASAIRTQLGWWPRQDLDAMIASAYRFHQAAGRGKKYIEVD